jgi:hypothetical protein
MFKRSIAGFVVLACSLVASGGELRDNEMVIGGGSGEANGLWASGPSWVVRRNAPGVSVGLMQTPRKERRFAYVLIVKGDEKRKELAQQESNCEVNGSTAVSKGMIEIANKKATFEYTVKIDPAGKLPPVETFTLNGKAIDVAKGRVLLVDLSAERVSWQQQAIQLPSPALWHSETKFVEAQAKQLVEQFRRDSKEVREFLK